MVETAPRRGRSSPSPLPALSVTILRGLDDVCRCLFTTHRPTSRDELSSSASPHQPDFPAWAWPRQGETPMASAQIAQALSGSPYKIQLAARSIGARSRVPRSLGQDVRHRCSSRALSRRTRGLDGRRCYLFLSACRAPRASHNPSVTTPEPSSRERTARAHPAGSPTGARQGASR